jgi:hypothetical protein
MKLKQVCLSVFFTVLCCANITKAQIQNGDFETTPTFNCTGATSWTNSILGVELTNCCTAGAPPTWWIDLTGCGYGNGRYIEQAVPTIVGRTYILEWDLGCLFNFTTAGMDVSINGALQGNYTNSTPGTPSVLLNWKHFRICFVASQASTTIRFTGNAPGNPGVIGLDNVKMISFEELFAIQGSLGEECNEFCLSLAQVVSYPGITPGNIEWYVNNVLEASGPTTYCRKFPKNVPTPVKVVFSESICGNTHTLETTITATGDCPCDLQSHSELITTHVPCYNYFFNIQTDPGYTSLATYWTVDGQLYAGPSPTLSLQNLSPGTHTICADMIGGVTGEGDPCCAKHCTVITVPEQTSESRMITYCPLGQPNGPMYNPCDDCDGYYELWNGGVLVGSSANGCFSYPIGNGYEMRCYDIFYTELAIYQCLRKTIYFNVQALPVTGVQYPDETIYIPCMANDVAYSINCHGFPNFKLYGSVGLITQGSAPAVVTLAAGDYTVECIDPENCNTSLTVVHVLPQPMVESTCNVFIELCWQLTDEGSQWYFTNFMNSCPDCRQTVLNATQTGPWVTQSYIPSSMYGPIRIVTREYFDAVNCRKCTVTFTVANAASTTINMNGAPCQSVPLPPCLQNQTIKMFISGHPENTTTLFAGASVVLCCANPYGIANPTYVIYSESDPCCMLIVNLDCGPQVPPRMGHGNPGQGEVEVGTLQIIPNPTASVFRIASDKGLEKYNKVEITDMNGRVMLTRSNIDSETMIDVGGFSKGTYFVNVSTGSGLVTLKLISVNE